MLSIRKSFNNVHMVITRWHKLSLVLAFVLLLVINVKSLYEVGLSGIYQAALSNWGAIQIFTDLSVSLTLVLVWLVHDCSRRKRPSWPWIAASLLAGAIVPVAYLIWSKAIKGEGSAPGSAK